ncbi:MAG: aminotransferase class I/II-fold pyridoxal phosphate-dependent enzyme, partial [Anaerolineaceae bacterium]|nr:aminotransferase class I/II-fold pyridoxal phosphate-dependent enzyme [Anaerolineaceae bacterium]
EPVSVAGDAERRLPRLQAIRAALEGGSRLVYMESPSRLSGATLDADEMAAIATMLADHDASAIIDRGLAPWVAAAVAGPTERVALIGEASPGAGIASWLAGYVALPQDWLPPIQSQKQIMAICTATPAQFGALEAGNLYPQEQPSRLEHMQALRARLQDRARAAGLDVLAGGAASVLALRLSPSQKARGLTRLADAGYQVADGSDFGAPDLLRLTVCDAAQAALDLLADA